ncbi:UDP-N-acetylmuramoyl-L-alanine--D-glutamate ligase [Bacillus timonensis]|uniref:UDP-N-acetylmuramoylalanine--D-glutamate ligase n=1 Tax=Bacillus timonensis TaxID=1033734 RepID=A0A4S3PXT9_9BACI|nr:UDP-N-acetylmuramoyl-L-alanine--D-glutamate ligase [Bacillus timonensis]THE14385.1 UDP-N-acetylmuramoyl-L-alanine--D-glutamate ligase [Bacillus timonensis]
MKNANKFSNKQILILGLAKSGFAAAKVLSNLGARLTVNDQKPFEENEPAQELEKLGIKVVCGGHPIGILDDHFDFIVKNPGIPYSNPLLVKAKEKGIPVITEVELAYHITPAEFIGITGSNGKTTTTTLIFEMLKHGEKSPLIAGNIGTVACEVAQGAEKENMIVTELSSFQLMGIEDFAPKIAVLLNIFDAHLDYHGTKEEYVKAKARIFENQTEDDYSVINVDDKDVLFAAEGSKAKKIPFSTTRVLQTGAYMKEQSIYFDDEKIIEIKDIVLPGVHNLENILAAVAVAKLVDTPNSAITQVLTTFTGVKHRLQYVTSIQNRKFYNDSKATNILATKKAISAFEQPIILLAGGLDRGNEFDDLVPELTHVKAMVLFGQTAKKLERAGRLARIEMIKLVDNVEAAVKEAYTLSNEGDVILLSPACASWDQHKTFEERGDIFINAVHKLK